MSATVTAPAPLSSLTASIALSVAVADATEYATYSALAPAKHSDTSSDFVNRLRQTRSPVNPHIVPSPPKYFPAPSPNPDGTYNPLGYPKYQAVADGTSKLVEEEDWNPWTTFALDESMIPAEWRSWEAEERGIGPRSRLSFVVPLGVIAGVFAVGILWVWTLSWLKSLW